MLIFENNQENDYNGGPSRLGFSYTSIPQLKISIIFGGCKDNDILLYDHSKKTWFNQSTGGKKPPARKFHAAVYIQSSCALLINGGQDELGRYCQDFYLLSIRQWKWRKIIINKCPSSRQKHAIIQKNKNELIMFGGLSPYNDSTKDIWILKLRYEKGGEGKCENLVIDCQREQTKNKLNIEGKCFSDNIVYFGDTLFAGFYAEAKKNQKYFEIYHYSFKNSSWSKINLNFPNAKIKFLKIQHQNPSFLLTYYSKQHQESLFYLYNTQNSTFDNIVYSKHDYLDNCDEYIIDNSSNNQHVCLKFDKSICILEYGIKDRQIQQENSASIEDYLIAIKHQQILSQQLTRKNTVLEQLYKEMQNYITFLHKEYVKYDEDSTIQQEKLRHIQDCKHLKHDYKRLDDVYNDVSVKIKELRGQLGAINEDFQRCMETEFDDQA